MAIVLDSTNRGLLEPGSRRRCNEAFVLPTLSPRVGGDAIRCDVFEGSSVYGPCPLVTLRASNAVRRWRVQVTVFELLNVDRFPSQTDL